MIRAVETRNDDADSRPCPVCSGSGVLLADTCPLCDGETFESPKEEQHYRCHICHKELQSAICVVEHERGRKHLYRLRVAGLFVPKLRAPLTALPPPLTVSEFYSRLAAGSFREIVVCTGAGVSTAEPAGILDFRSPGGLFEAIRERFASRFPNVAASPECLLSRDFACSHPQTWREEVLPWLQSWRFETALPTSTHKFCGWLHRQGWLRRLYTQNVDGLHTHPEAGVPPDRVVECHGSFRDGSTVLYGDQLPERFYRCCAEDFHAGAEPRVDLVLTLGTSLQVAPFCAVPNLAPRGCVRVLVNMHLADCLMNNWSSQTFSSEGCCDNMSPYDSLGGNSRVRQWTTTKLAGISVALQPLWPGSRPGGGSTLSSKHRYRSWHQLLIETTCDAFVESFFASLGPALHEVPAE